MEFTLYHLKVSARILLFEFVSGDKNVSPTWMPDFEQPAYLSSSTTAKSKPRAAHHTRSFTRIVFKV